MAARKSATAGTKKKLVKRAKTKYIDTKRTGQHKVAGVTLDLDKLAKLYPKRGCTVHIDIMDDGDGGRRRRGNRNTVHRLHVPPEPQS